MSEHDDLDEVELRRIEGALDRQEDAVRRAGRDVPLNTALDRAEVRSLVSEVRRRRADAEEPQAITAEGARFDE